MKISGTKEWATVTVNCTIGCPNNCRYCVDGDTPILMANGLAKPIKDIEIGEKIVGFEIDNKLGPLYKESVVLNHWKVNKRAWKITLDSGRKLICSDNHRWYTNRGWKYTTGTEQGKDRRPHLTTSKNIKINFLCDMILESERPDTPEYMAGYLSGMIRGDGTLKRYDYSSRNRKTDIIHTFRLALNDKEGIDRTKEFLEYFDIQTIEFVFQNRKTGMPAIRTNQKENFYKIGNLIEYSEHPDYRRGFLAGIFDAEGHGKSMRISNTDEMILRFIKDSLKYFNFNYIVENYNNHCPNIRISGGKREAIRFFQETKPAISRKFPLLGSRHNYGGETIKLIEPLGEERELFDITTSTETFVANGFLSHNCYGKRISAMRGDISSYSEWPRKNETRRNIEKEKTKYSGTVMFPSMHDIHLDNLEVCIDLIANVLEAGNKILITSKPQMECIQRICDDFKNYKDKILFRFTIGTLDDDTLQLWEPGAPNAAERIACLAYAKAKGFQTSVSMEPMLNSLTVVEDAKIMLPFVTDGIWIGKMNKIRDRVTRILESEIERIEAGQTDAEVRRIYEALRYEPKIRWKESFKEVLGLELAQEAGLDR